MTKISIDEFPTLAHLEDFGQARALQEGADAMRGCYLFINSIGNKTLVEFIKIFPRPHSNDRAYYYQISLVIRACETKLNSDWFTLELADETIALDTAMCNALLKLATLTVQKHIDTQQAIIKKWEPYRTMFDKEVILRSPLNTA